MNKCKLSTSHLNLYLLGVFILTSYTAYGILHAYPSYFNLTCLFSVCQITVFKLLRFYYGSTNFTLV